MEASSTETRRPTRSFPMISRPAGLHPRWFAVLQGRISFPASRQAFHQSVSRAVPGTHRIPSRPWPLPAGPHGLTDTPSAIELTSNSEDPSWTSRHPRRAVRVPVTPPALPPSLSGRAGHVRTDSPLNEDSLSGYALRAEARALAPVGCPASVLPTLAQPLTPTLMGTHQGPATSTCCRSASTRVFSQHLDGFSSNAARGMLHPNRTGFAPFQVHRLPHTRVWGARARQRPPGVCCQTPHRHRRCQALSDPPPSQEAAMPPHPADPDSEEPCSAGPMTDAPCDDPSETSSAGPTDA